MISSAEAAPQSTLDVTREAATWLAAVNQIEVPMNDVVRLAHELRQEMTASVVLDEFTMGSLKSLCLMSVLAKSVGVDAVFERVLEEIRVVPRSRLERGFLLEALNRLIGSGFLGNEPVALRRLLCLQGCIVNVL